jgi:hypothetical protein
MATLGAEPQPASQIKPLAAPIHAVHLITFHSFIPFL